MTKTAVFGLFYMVLGAGSALAQATQEREWSLDSTDNQAFLVFGVPDTDDVGLSFWCEAKGGTMAVYLPEPLMALKQNQSVPMTLSVDGSKTVLAGHAARDEASGKFTVEGKFKPSDKLFSQLKNGNSISISVKGHADTFPLADADFEGLADACSGNSGAN